MTVEPTTGKNGADMWQPFIVDTSVEEKDKWDSSEITQFDESMEMLHWRPKWMNCAQHSSVPFQFLIILIEIIWCDMAICFNLCIRMRMNAYRTLVHIFPMKWSSHTTFKSNVCVCVWRNVHDSMRAENTQNHLLHSSVRLLVGSECVETCEMIHEWRTWNENSMICCHIFRNWNVNKVEALATRCRLGGSSSISGSCDRYILGCFRNPCVFSCWLLSVFAGSWTNDTRIFEQFYHCYLDVSSFFIGLL